MLLVTWNVNSLRARMPRVLELLQVHTPDVLCLQETKVAPGEFPHLEFQAAGYTAVEHSSGRWAGVAVLAPSSSAPTDVRRGLPGEPDPDDARWIEATVGDVRVVSTYVINGRSLDDPMFTAKLGFLDAACARAERLVADGPAAILGDFNIAPDDRDVYAPERFVGGTHVTDQERSRLRRMLDAGLVDAYRAVEPDTVQYTWWDYRAGHFHKNLGLRIDLALVTADLADRVTWSGIAREFRKGTKPSDHAPLLVELR